MLGLLWARVSGWRGFEIGVGRSNFRIGLGVGSGIVGAGGANFEVGTPDPRLQFATLFAVRLVVQVAQLGWPGQPIEMRAKQGFRDWLASFTTRRAARISAFEFACVGITA